jgi:hypothetical protein
LRGHEISTDPFYNSENASEALNEYLESIGGREALIRETEQALKTKKRGRPSSSSTPQPGSKRSKRNGDHPADSEPPLSARAATWKPPPGSWEDHIAQLDACEDEESGKLMVYLTWKNGHKTCHETGVIYQRAPQKVCFLGYTPGQLTDLVLDVAVLRTPHPDRKEGSRCGFSHNPVLNP